MCNDPADNNRELVTEIDDGLFIPMGMDGSTCRFSSRCHTQNETQVYKRVVISHETDWDPSTVHFNVSLVEMENRYELISEYPFTNLSNSPCDIYL